MQNLGAALETAIMSMTDSHCEEHTCPICMQVVPKLELAILGNKKMVQPRCKCEVEHYEQGITESVELKSKNDIKRKFGISKLGERFNECKFDSFSLRDGSEKVAKMANDYAMNFPVYGGDSLLIWGEPGNGKSHLAASVCHVIQERGYIPVFQTMPELLERIRSTFRGKAESEKEIMDALRDCDLLVLDDIGAEKVTDWVLEVLFRIIDGRYRQKKPTLLTTNFSPQELLKRFMPNNPNSEQEITAKRIHDRIIEISTIVENTAKSYRMEVAVKRRMSEEEKKKRMWSE
jgi:DNA replication protein DnaC